MIPLNDKILVRSSEIRDDYVKYGSLDLFRDAMYNPTGYARCYAEVVALPPSLTDRWNQSILERIKPGDRVYFDYRGLADALDKQIAKDLFLIPWHFLYYVVPVDGKPFAMDGWILGKYVYADGVEEIEVDGHKIMVRTSASGLVTSTTEKPIPQQAEVIDVGETLPQWFDEHGVEWQNGVDLELEPGDIIHHMLSANFEYEIEGEDRLIIEQDTVMGCLK